MAIETQNGYPSIRITAGERVLRKAAELVPYEGNPRRHGEKQMQALRRSLREFGFLRPLLIDRENRLVAGQAVLQAAMAEGMDVVPCILAEGLTAEQRRAYILADNRLAELAEWDRQALRVELQALNDLGFDLELTGFSLEALPFRLDGEPPAAEEDAEAPVQGRAPLESGRCYQLGRHRLYVGDATSPGALDALMDGAKARLLLTDPPYNVNLYGEAKPRSRTGCGCSTTTGRARMPLRTSWRGRWPDAPGTWSRARPSTCGMPPCTRSAPTMPAPGAGWGCASS